MFGLFVHRSLDAVAAVLLAIGLVGLIESADVTICSPIHCNPADGLDRHVIIERESLWRQLGIGFAQAETNDAVEPAQSPETRPETPGTTVPWDPRRWWTRANYNLLTIFIVTIAVSAVAAAVVLLWWRFWRRPEQSDQRSDEYLQRPSLEHDDAETDTGLALLKNIQIEATRVRQTVDNLRSTLTDIENRPHSKDEQQPTPALLDKANMTLREREPPTAEVALLAEILVELRRASSKLWLVEDTAGRIFQKEGNKESVESAKIAELEKNCQQAEAALLDFKKTLEEKNATLQEKDGEIARLEKLNEEAKKQKADAERIRADVVKLVEETGLPTFLNRTEDGAHFPCFLDFLFDASTSVSDEVDRLELMLRLFSAANKREDAPFELFWSVHEVGRALYTVMQALGHDANWQFIEASAWARALNKEGRNRFSIFVPVVAATFNGVEMSGGSANSLIEVVKSWGVRNKTGNVERRAIVK